VREDDARFIRTGEALDVTAGDVGALPQYPQDYEGKLKLFHILSPTDLDEADISLEDPPQSEQPPALPNRNLGRTPTAHDARPPSFEANTAITTIGST
jgi:hypothetical protein